MDPDWLRYKDAVEMIVPVLALVISFMSIALTVFSVLAQQHHSRKSVLPIPFIRLSDYQNLLAVELVNGGAGTFLVDTVLVTSSRARAERAKSGKQVRSPLRSIEFHAPRFRGRAAQIGEFDSLVDCVETQCTVRKWDEFLQMHERRPVRASEAVLLLQLSGDEGDEEFVRERVAVRAALAMYHVIVTGHNVYGERVTPAVSSLDWFGRELDQYGRAVARRGAGGM